jgi:hypothetical protein
MYLSMKMFMIFSKFDFIVSIPQKMVCIMEIDELLVNN